MKKDRTCCNKGRGIRRNSRYDRDGSRYRLTSEKIFVKIFEKESLELKDKGINLEKLPAVVILDENGRVFNNINT